MGNSNVGAHCSFGPTCLCLDEPAKKPPVFAKVRPLLSDLEQDFYSHCGKDQVMSRNQLLKLWQKAVERKAGKLSGEDREIMELSADYYFREIDVDRSRTISVDEFVVFMMGATEDRGPLRLMRKRIDEAVQADHLLLHRIVQQFKEWDKDGDGYVTKAEMDNYVRKLSKQYGDHDEDVEATRKICAEVFNQVDIDEDGRVDMWDVVAHALGRRKMPVEVMLYDVSKGFMESVGSLLIGDDVKAVHSSLIVFGCEYFYGGKLYRGKPPCTRQYGEPLEAPWGKPLAKSQYFPELPVMHVGYTLLTQEEFLQWLKKKGRDYDRESYDLLTHSCNHFANEASIFLTGQEVPAKIFELQKVMLANETVLAVRPTLSRVFTGFADGEKSITASGFSVDYLPEYYKGNTDHEFQAGDHVIINGEFVDGLEGQVVALIVQEDVLDETVEIRYFDVKQLKLASLTGVPRSAVKRDMDPTQTVELNFASPHASMSLNFSQNLGSMHLTVPRQDSFRGGSSQFQAADLGSRSASTERLSPKSPARNGSWDDRDRGSRRSLAGQDRGMVDTSPLADKGTVLSPKEEGKSRASVVLQVPEATSRLPRIFQQVRR